MEQVVLDLVDFLSGKQELVGVPAFFVGVKEKDRIFFCFTVIQILCLQYISYLP